MTSFPGELSAQCDVTGEAAGFRPIQTLLPVATSVGGTKELLSSAVLPRGRLLLRDLLFELQKKSN